jgi:hypothetical protein
MRALVVVAVDEVVEALLLLKQVLRGSGRNIEVLRDGSESPAT